MFEQSVRPFMKSMDNQNSNLQTQTVAQKLLAQVKPSILKIIQSKIETIVQELCDEGVFDEKTILNVLEQRASQIFPEKYMR
jgi:predicted transcriptional regulator YheO